MKTLWDKGGQLDAEVAAFTVGDDRENDAHFARHDVLTNLAHVEVLRDAELLSEQDADALQQALRELWPLALSGELRPEPQDEDIHSAIERRLTVSLGDAGKRVHTARSRNDQIATDIALWLREQALAAHQEALAAAQALAQFAEAHADVPLAGMTHLQPAMPSSFGLWAAGYASLLLDDAHALQGAFDAADACPLGSAAGYGVPHELAPISRELSAKLLGFGRPVLPATAVQGGRGKPEAALLYALTQAATTCARLARDVVLSVHPAFGVLKLPSAFTTGSSIMPQKRNPDVMELIRGHAQIVQSALFEVLSLASSVPGGYHRDFQLLKGPLLRGSQAARAVLRMVAYVIPGVEVVPERAEAGCTPGIYATHRALELVVAGTPFRDAYRQVADELSAGQLPTAESRPLASAAPALAQLGARQRDERAWSAQRRDLIEVRFSALLGEAS